MKKNLGDNEVAGGKLKETGTIHWLAPNTGATNESGFSAVPGGYRGQISMYINTASSWWSSDLVNSHDDWGDLMSPGGASIGNTTGDFYVAGYSSAETLEVVSMMEVAKVMANLFAVSGTIKNKKF